IYVRPGRRCGGIRPRLPAVDLRPFRHRVSPADPSGARFLRRRQSATKPPNPLHIVPALFSTTLSGSRPELYRAVSVLRAPQKPPLSRRNSICDVSAFQPIPKEGRGHGQLPLSALPPAPGQRAPGLAVLAAGGLRT